MIFFNCDYNEGAHENIIKRLAETNREQTVGYGEDDYCRQAAEMVLEKCEMPEAQVHFLVGGTQTNLTADRGRSEALAGSHFRRYRSYQLS